MVFIGREYDWYRPYVYNNYIIKDIKFYDKNGVVLEIEGGWLENKNRDLKYIKLDIDEILLKRKEDFSINGAFMISKGKDYSDELTASLYIHVDLVDLHFTEYKKEFDSIRKYYVGVDSDNQEFDIAKNVKWLKADVYNYRAKIEESAKIFNGIYDSTTKEELERSIKDIKKYIDKMFKAQETLENYSVEDYLVEIGKEVA